MGSEARALYAALLFAVHPVHCEVVVNIASRAEMLCGLVILATLTLGLAPGLPLGVKVVGVPTLVLLGALCKETAVVAPVLVVALGALQAVAASEPTRSVVSESGRGSHGGVFKFAAWTWARGVAGPWVPHAVAMLTFQAAVLLVRMTVISSG